MMKYNKKKIFLIFLVALLSMFYFSSCLTVEAAPRRINWGIDWNKIWDWIKGHKEEEINNEELTDEEKETEEYAKVLRAIECSTAGKAKNLLEAYGLKVELNNGEFTISMNNRDQYNLLRNNKQIEPPSFIVSRILITDVTQRVISYQEYMKNNNLLRVLNDFYTKESLNSNFNNIGDQVLTGNSSISFNNISQDMVIYYVVLESTESDETLSEECGIKEAKSIFAFPIFSYGQGEIMTTINFCPGISIQDNKVTGNRIDCGQLDANNLPLTDVYKQKYSEGSFEYKYCEDAYNARSKINSPTAPTQIRKFLARTTENGSNLKDIITYQEHIEENQNDQLAAIRCKAFDGNNFGTVQEKNYIVGNVKQSVVLGQYIYNYGGQDPDNNYISKTESLRVTEDIKCDIDCTEVITVEYDSPVASIAGMCFTYDVKVTSRVNCNSKIEQPPKMSHNSCTPSAYCWDPAPEYEPDDYDDYDDYDYYDYDPYEGPNDDFDICILECDGGKYTSNCSHECYKKIYDKTVSIDKKGNFDFRQVIKKLINQEPMNQNCDPNKCFFYSTGTMIKWAPANCVARPYLSSDGKYHGPYTYVKNYDNGGGIPCAMSCTLRCEWTSCNNGRETYLNPDELCRDADENVKRYEQAQKICNTFSKCSTQEATFSIKVGYNYKEKETTKSKNIYFPYSKNDQNFKDTIKYRENADSNSCTSSTDEFESTIIDSDGCYKCDKGNKGPVSYETKWGLKSTWIRNKTGEISYSPQSNIEWTKRNEFCLPFDTEDVNEKWWTAYYLDEMKKKNLSLSFEDYEYTRKIEGCKIEHCKSASEIFSEEDTSNIKYNIKANTDNFGLFAWSIDIECFYALNSKFPKVKTEEICEITGENCPTIDNNNNYVIRSVDLNQLFPSSGDTALDRSPGFNWSQYATVSKEKAGSETSTSQSKITNYTSYPKEYASWIQTKQYEVYSDEYLDYYVKLTKDIIRSLKSSDRNYTSFEGETYVGNVINYRSKLFAKDGLLSGDNNIYPNTQTLKCNNIGGNKSGNSGYDADCFYVEDLQTTSDEEK